MERRDFLKKTAFVMATATLAPAALSAAGSEFSPQAPQGNVNDYKIISDTVKNGIRYVSATPSAKVCSKQIDIEIDVKTQTIRNCAFTRGDFDCLLLFACFFFFPFLQKAMDCSGGYFSIIF